MGSGGRGMVHALRSGPLRMRIAHHVDPFPFSPLAVKEEEAKAKAAALQEKLSAKGQKKGGKKK